MEVDDDVAPFEWTCSRVEMAYRTIGNKHYNMKVFIRNLLEHNIPFLTSTTRKDGKGLKVENIGQSFQVLQTCHIRKIPKILTWTPFPGKILLILSFCDVVAFELSGKFSFVLTHSLSPHSLFFAISCCLQSTRIFLFRWLDAFG